MSAGSAWAETLHFRAAISVAIAQLERQLRTVLMVRNRRGVALTPAGEILVRRAEAVEQQIAAAEQEIRLSGSGVEGPLVVGGTPGVLASLVPRAMLRLARPGRRLSLRVVKAADAELNELLRTARIDLALTTVGIEKVPADIEELFVEEDDLVVAVAPHHSLPDAPVDFRVLADEPWVLPSADGLYRRQVDALFLSAQMRFPANLVRCDSLATTKEIVRRTLYISVFPQRVVAGEIAHGALRAIPLKQQGIVRQVGVRRLSRGGHAPAAVDFVEALLETQGASPPRSVSGVLARPLP